MGKCVFSNLWLQKSLYKDWLREVKGDKHKARCIVCMKDVDISSMGESALTSHLKGKKHQTLTSQKRSLASVPDFFGVSSQQPATTSDDAKEVSKSASSESGEHNTLNPTKSSTTSSSGSSVMERIVTRDETLKAEILWALKVIMSHYSYKSCEGTSKLFQAMFPDSRIASQFTCGEKKCAYLICFGLAPHFKQLLKDVVKKEEAYVLMFDESLNSVCQSKQMDIHIRSWNHDKHEVESRYYTSVFMGHGTAEDMLSHFRSGIEGIPLKKVYQVGCNSRYIWVIHEIVCKICFFEVVLFLTLNYRHFEIGNSTNLVFTQLPNFNYSLSYCPFERPMSCHY